MAEDLQREAKGGEQPTCGVRRCHGGQDAQRYMARGLLRGNHQRVAIGWFYITEPRDPEWAAAPEFQSGIPMQLTSWKEKGLAWGASMELTELQNCVKNMISKKIKLVNVVQVMLLRRIFPC